MDQYTGGHGHSSRLIVFNTLLLLILGVFLYAACGQKNVIYLNPGGSDLHAGTRKAPMKSLQAALDKVVTLRASGKALPAEICLQQGTYTLPAPIRISNDHSGTKKDPLVILAEDGSDVVLSGGIALENRTIRADGVWEYRLPEELDPKKIKSLYVNGRRATLARTPDEGFFRMAGVEEEVLVQGSGRAPELAIQTILVDSIAWHHLSALPEEDLQNTRFRAYFKWDNTIRYIDGLHPDKQAFHTKGSGMKPWNSMGAGTRYFIEGNPSSFDCAGEWYADNHTITYRPLPGEKIERSTVVVPRLEHLMTIEGENTGNDPVQYIRFEGIAFSHTSHNLQRPGFEPAQAAATVDAALMVDHARHIDFIDCAIEKTGQHGCWFREACSDIRVEHCRFHNLGGGGIRIGTSSLHADTSLYTHRVTIENNIIQSGGHEYPCAVGVWIGQAHHNRIVHNDIGDFRYTGISVGWQWGYAYSPAKHNKILYNHIHHIGQGLLSDMGGVYTLGPSEGTEVSFNVIHDIDSYSYGGWGLYTDEGSSGIRMESNLVYNTRTGGFHQHYGKENVIKNNILAFADLYQVQATRVEDHLSFQFKNNIVLYDSGVLLRGPWDRIRVEMDSNCYWHLGQLPIDFAGMPMEEWRELGRDRSSIIANPGFSDPRNRDFSSIRPDVAASIGFVPFDPGKAGVYGKQEWIDKARNGAFY